jgi:hypothetical protein
VRRGRERDARHVRAKAVSSSATRPLQAGRWQVPICVAGQKDAADSCHLLTDVRQTVPVAKGCASWIFANAGARGYYRTAYSPAMLKAMAPHIEGELTPAERLSLVDDEWALVRAGRHSAADYLTLVTAFGRERTSVILSEIIGHLKFHPRLPGPRPSRRRNSRRSSDRCCARRSTSSASRQPPLTATIAGRLRAGIVSALGRTGNDPDVIAKSRAALDRSLQGGAPLEASVAAAVTSVAAGHGDRKLFDALVAGSERASDSGGAVPHPLGIGGVSRSRAHRSRVADGADTAGPHAGRVAPTGAVSWQSGGAGQSVDVHQGQLGRAEAESGDFRRRYQPRRRARVVL